MRGLIRDILWVLRFLFLSVLFVVFALVVCLTHPIFVLTTLASLSVTTTRMSVALLKRRFGTDRHAREEARTRTPGTASELPLSRDLAGGYGPPGRAPDATPVDGTPITTGESKPVFADCGKRHEI